MQYDWIIGIDPSGAFTEGKGTTGYCLLHTPDMKLVKAGDIIARNFDTKEDYWNKHLQILEALINPRKKTRKHKIIVIIEDYILYENKMNSQVNSRMETSKLIGIIQLWCFTHNIPYKMQLAAEVKNRWTDEILEWKGYIHNKSNKYYIKDTDIKVHNHIRDSIRHAIHYATFKNGVTDEKK